MLMGKWSLPLESDSTENSQSVAISQVAKERSIVELDKLGGRYEYENRHLGVLS